MTEADSAPIAVRLETAARLTDTSPATLMYMIKRGTLPARKVGRSWRVRVADLHTLVDPEAVTR